MLSLVIPFYNEAESLPALIKHLIEVGEKISSEYEIVLVDDGSTDNSISNIKDQISKLHIKNQKEIKLYLHKKRLGKGQALRTGLEHSKGDIIVFMDADLQDDPEDLPKYLEKIAEGYDFVNGKRTRRHNDNLLLRAYSVFAEKFLKIFINSPYSDINCGFKAFKKSVLDDFAFYGNNFRFFPLAVFYNGYKVTEIEVKNKPRQFGKSKFGSGKLIGGIFDTLSAYFIYKFAERPLHFFGVIGGVLFLVGFLISFYLTIERLFFGVLLYQRPVLWLGLSLIIVGIQIVMTGILGELVIYLDKKKNN